MLKSIKYFSRITLPYVLGLIGIPPILIVIYRILFGGDMLSATSMIGAVFGVTIVLAFAVCMTVGAYYVNIAISMSATRKSIFVGAQLAKLIMVGATVLSVCTNQLCINLAFDGDAFIESEFIIVLIGVFLLMASFGELIGFVCNRFGKIGMFIYMATFIIIGGVCGGLAVAFADNIGAILNRVAALHLLALAIGVGLAALLTAFSALLLKKCVVRG